MPTRRRGACWPARWSEQGLVHPCDGPGLAAVVAELRETGGHAMRDVTVGGAWNSATLFARGTTVASPLRPGRTSPSANRRKQQRERLLAMEERQRLARELHDSVSQALYGISLGAHTALTLFDT